MASQSIQLLTARTVPSDYIQPLEEIVDLGAYKQLNAAIHVLTTNSNATVSIEHAAIKEESAFSPLAGMSASCDSAGVNFVTTSSFLRYIRVSVGNFVAGTDPAVSITVIAKE